ncbi:MAG: CHASE domain-containing protein [Stappiaceae bacterium]
MLGGVALFNSVGTVTRQTWHKYVETLQLEKNLPGLQGYGFAEYFHHSRKAVHIRRVRSEGFTAFDIYPAGERETYASIIYLEPFRDRNLRAFGYDMLSESVRREAMQRARDTGKVAISGAVTLVQETRSDIQRGFLMYLPVYRGGTIPSTLAERRSLLKGFVYSPFRAADFMQGVLGRAHPEASFRIRDVGEDGLLLFDSEGDYSNTITLEANQLTQERQLIVGGQPWLLEFRSAPTILLSSEKRQPFLVAGAGLLIDILLFIIIATLANQRSRARSLASSVIGELRLAKEQAERAAQMETRSRAETEVANDKLKTANEGLQQFNKIVAHDLRAPLKRLESFVTILNEDHEKSLDRDGKDVLVRIKRSSLRMRQMLDSIQKYAKYDSITIDQHVARPRAFVEQALEVLGAELDDAIITLDIDDSLRVQGDGDLLSFVMQNLISNSIKFCGKGTPEISIAVRSGQNDMIELSVSDRGIGIPAQYSEAIFEMFERLHNEDEYEGTGIGLAICRKIVTDHGGKIVVDTEWKKGARFVVSLKKAASVAVG